MGTQTIYNDTIVVGTLSAQGTISSPTISASNIFANNVAYTLVNTTSSIRPVRGSNTASGIYSNVAGGQCNITGGPHSSVGGGCCNTACASFFEPGDSQSTIGGGSCNRANGPSSVIAGGSMNTACGFGSVIGGGLGNTTSGYGFTGGSTIAGGVINIACGVNSAIAGGFCNTASGSYSFIAGGANNDTRNFANTFILGSSLSATAANFTYVNNLSSQGRIFSQTLSVGTLSAAAVGGSSTCKMPIYNNSGGLIGYIPIFPS